MAKRPGKSNLIAEQYRLFETHYPNPVTELTYDSSFQLLVAVILSAQCTDARVNQVTPILFKKYPNANALSHAKLSHVEKIIHSCGFYRNKAKNIVHMASDLENRFDGKIPNTLEELVTLSGVGRKTASVVLNQAYDQPAIAVDTHVFRVSHKLGWAKGKTPEKVEFELRDLFPPHQWGKINGMLILHGRKLCKARSPLCQKCFLNKTCPSYRNSEA